jgi:DNA invertase Pin-like site-specific DNA recombinase
MNANDTVLSAGTPHTDNGKAAHPSSPFLRSNKIEARHQERLAIVYVRQSDPQQVLKHRESTDLQYQLVRLAVDLGWPRERIEVFDEDQGISGRHAEGRHDFQRLLAEVSLEHVGVILGREMSRLARSCKDWYQLLELCALFGTVLVDIDGVYDPANFNDRLLLGLKGTMSEAELHIMQGRLNAGRLNKARRGELFNHAPIGYLRDARGDLLMDADEQAQAVVRLVLDKFEQLGSLNALLQYLVQQDIRLPVRPHFGVNRGQLEWHRPNRQTLRNILHNPIYAGAYCHGRRAVDPRRQVPGRRWTGRTVVAPEKCQVLIKDRLPAYISWEQYQSNVQRLQDNHARAGCRGAAREGVALLGGLLVCGRCGRRMLVSYPGKRTRVRYSCQRQHIDYGEPLCQSLAGERLDAFIGQQVLSALEPAALELSLQAATELERERERLHQHWQQRLERARYEVERAARQYQAVEPENRLVARELEKRWEQALLEQRRSEEEYDRFQREQPQRLTTSERGAIEQLATDIPALWQASSTTPADRQTIVRYLIERVRVDVQEESEGVDVTIDWLGGFVSRHEQTRAVARYEQLRDFRPLLERINELKEAGSSSKQIAAQLNADGFRPPKRRATYNAAMVRQLLSRHFRKAARSAAKMNERLAESEWWLNDLASQLDMPSITLHHWLRRGWVHARKLAGPRARWVLWADADEIHRLSQLRQTKQGWSDQPYPPELTTPKDRKNT